MYAHFRRVGGLLNPKTFNPGGVEKERRPKLGQKIRFSFWSLQGDPFHLWEYRSGTPLFGELVYMYVEAKHHVIPETVHAQAACQTRNATCQSPDTTAAITQASKF